MYDKDFAEEVYSIVRQIPRGKVASYGNIAHLAGRPFHARLVGRIMSATPGGKGIPAHRVVNSQGRTAPFWHDQRGLLEVEGIEFRKNGHVDMKIFGWKFNETI